jgi:hypothetical protein
MLISSTRLSTSGWQGLGSRSLCYLHSMVLYGDCERWMKLEAPAKEMCRTLELHVAEEEWLMPPGGWQPKDSAKALKSPKHLESFERNELIYRRPFRGHYLSILSQYMEHARTKVTANQGALWNLLCTVRWEGSHLFLSLLSVFTAQGRGREHSLVMGWEKGVKETWDWSLEMNNLVNHIGAYIFTIVL